MRALRDGAEARDLIAAHFRPGVRTNHFLAPAEGGRADGFVFRMSGNKIADIDEV